MPLRGNCCLRNGLGFCKLKWARMKPTCKCKHNTVNQPVQISGHTYRRWKLWMGVCICAFFCTLTQAGRPSWGLCPAYRCYYWRQGLSHSPEATKPASGTSGCSVKHGGGVWGLGRAWSMLVLTVATKPRLCNPHSANLPLAPTVLWTSAQSQTWKSSWTSLGVPLAHWLHARLSCSALGCCCTTRWHRGDTPGLHCDKHSDLTEDSKMWRKDHSMAQHLLLLHRQTSKLPSGFCYIPRVWGSDAK